MLVVRDSTVYIGICYDVFVCTCIRVTSSRWQCESYLKYIFLCEYNIIHYQSKRTEHLTKLPMFMSIAQNTEYFLDICP